MGRSTLSRPPSSRAPCQHENMPQPQRPSRNSQITAGIHTKADPPTGSMESSAASTPNTTGEGRPAMAKPMPINIPCSNAVTLVPNTMARVTPLNCRNSRSLRSSSSGIRRRARAHHGVAVAQKKEQQKQHDRESQQRTQGAQEERRRPARRALHHFARAGDQPGLHLLRGNIPRAPPARH